MSAPLMTSAGRPPRGRLNDPLALRRILRQPTWLFKDLAPMRLELRRPADYVRGVVLWARIRQQGYTMLGCRRGRTLFRLARQIERAEIPGALVDCGVWNGGSTALLSAGAPSRQAYAFDSFEGLPAPDEQADGAGADWVGECLGVMDNVREALRKYGSPERLRIVKGWFADSFPQEAGSIGPIAVLHADGDWYDSVMLTLETFYDQVSPGGFVVVDDFGAWEGARKAVEEFRAARSVTTPLVVVEAAAYWRKPAAT